MVEALRSSVKNKDAQAIIWSGFIDRDIEDRAIQKKIIAIPKVRPYVRNNPIASGHIRSILTLVRTLEWLLSFINVSSLETYKKLTSYITNFLNDSKSSDYEKNVFIMTSFEKNPKLEEITKVIKDTLSARSLVGHRADAGRFTNILWDNVCTYIFGCKYGIAVLENFSRDEFNPNVALEYGYMIALGKETLLLKEKQFKTRADIHGTMHEEFDKDSLATTIPAAINNWLNSLGLP